MASQAGRGKEVAFTTRRGQEVVARLDLPPGRLRAYALFAHCFGPNGDDAAAAFVAGLAEYGLAVLSFELTAPTAPPNGQSVTPTAQGEAAPRTAADIEAAPLALDSQDIVDAAEALRSAYGPVEVLIGHSVAGAAVLRAAPELHEVRAVATIASPSDQTHVQHLLEDDRATVEARGEGRVWVAERFARLRASFLDELEETEMRHALWELRRPLLVMHSPVDNVVGIDNARRIYDAARHPKSFVSLANADHEFSRPVQAHMAGELVGAWSATVLPPEPPPLPGWGDDEVAYAHTGLSLRSDASAGGFPLVLDEPVSNGGDNSGPDPYDLLRTALAGCTSMTLRLYADRKGWPLEGVTSRVTHRYVQDETASAVAGSRAARVDEFDIQISLEGPDLSAEQRQRLLQIAHRCPVHRTLSGAALLSARLVESAEER